MLVAGLCALMLAPLGACGSDDDPGAGGGPTATPVASAPSSPAEDLPPAPSEMSLLDD